jgi:uncharacterized damage-inducible protein DinB
MTTPSIKQIALGDLDQEIATTRRVLEAVPDEHLGWKPHEKSMTLGALASHITTLLRWQVAMLEQDGFDLAAPQPHREPPKSRQEILDTFDANLAAFKASYDAAAESTFGEPWALKKGDQQIFQLPKLAVLRVMGLSHIAHHRGQLSVYLRLLDVPVPSIYGPSADERVF